MKEVIRINLDEQQQEEKPVEFTHYLSELDGWKEITTKLSRFNKIVYLGGCKNNGDMFAAYHEYGGIYIYKGHLNSGKY